MDVAASLQERLEEIYIHLAVRLVERTGLRDLCLAGGVALNAVANGRLLRETPSSGFTRRPPSATRAPRSAPPTTSGTRSSTGRAGSCCAHAYTGPAFDDDACAAAIAAAGLEAERLGDDELFAVVAERLEAGDVVGWFQGRMELGPRALGHRSILADPRRAELREVLNARIKHREPFRPFAVVDPRRARSATGSSRTRPRRSWRSSTARGPSGAAEIPAARTSTTRAACRRSRRTTRRATTACSRSSARRTGVPLLINTSFNEDEPIVCTPAEALDTFLRTHMDVLVLGNLVVRRGATARRPSSGPPLPWSGDGQIPETGCTRTPVCR